MNIDLKEQAHGEIERIFRILLPQNGLAVREEQISYIRMLKDRGIIIRFEKEGLDTSRVTSEIFFTWTSAFAQGESESLSNNVKWGKRKGYSQGRFAFPYSSMLGYRKGEDGEPEIVPEEAEHIKMIFNLFLLGRSLRQIKEALERRNVLTPRGNTEWSLSYPAE